MSNSTWAHRITTAAVSAVLAGGALLSTAGTSSAAAPATISAAPTAAVQLSATQHPTVVTEVRYISTLGTEAQCQFAGEQAKREKGWDWYCVKHYQVPGHPNAGLVWDLYYDIT